MRRLLADAERMRDEFAGHPYISVEAIGWDPPEEYRVTYRVPGLTFAEGAPRPERSEEHRIIIKLTAGYPREKPYCRTETPIFHPNFGQREGDEICIGDYWTPAQALSDIIIKIGEMIQYREYNVNSALNSVAGNWAEENEGIFPIGDVTLYRPEADVTLVADSEPMAIDIVMD